MPLLAQLAAGPVAAQGGQRSSLEQGTHESGSEMGAFDAILGEHTDGSEDELQSDDASESNPTLPGLVPDASQAMISDLTSLSTSVETSPEAPMGRVSPGGNTLVHNGVGDLRMAPTPVTANSAGDSPASPVNSTLDSVALDDWVTEQVQDVARAQDGRTDKASAAKGSDLRSAAMRAGQPTAGKQASPGPSELLDSPVDNHPEKTTSSDSLKESSNTSSVGSKPVRPLTPVPLAPNHVATLTGADLTGTTTEGVQSELSVPEVSPSGAAEWSPEMMEQAVHLDPERALRIEIDADLAMEVQLGEEGVEVLIEGTPKALEPLEDLDNDLRETFRDSGTDLYEFTKREREENPEQKRAYNNTWNGHEAGQDSNDQTSAKRGSVINAVA